MNAASASKWTGTRSYARQVDLPLVYDGVRLECGYRADLIVAEQILLEIKSIERIMPLHEAQLLT